MTVYLLDVNTIISLLWPSHIHHPDTQKWFVRRAKIGWATSSLTQAGFVRIVSNPSFSKHAVTPAEALRVLAANMRHPQHRFLADDIEFAALVEPLTVRRPEKARCRS
jgi:predicted nucleic acid-binding protein